MLDATAGLGSDSWAVCLGRVPTQEQQPPTQLKMYAPDLRGEPRNTLGPNLTSWTNPLEQQHVADSGTLGFGYPLSAWACLGAEPRMGWAGLGWAGLGLLGWAEGCVHAGKSYV